MTKRRNAHRERPPHRPKSSPIPTGEGGTRTVASATDWLYGLHPVAAALANPERRPRRLLLTEEAEKTLLAQGDDILHRPPVERVTRADLDARFGPGTVHQGMALEVPPLPERGIEDVLDALQGRDRAVIVVLDRPNDPHNLGAVLRSAAAFGAAAVVVPDRGTPEVTATVAKSASGAVERVPLVRAGNLARTLRMMQEANFWIAGLDGRAELSLDRAGLSGRIGLVLGSEGEGLRRLTRDICDHLVRIPIEGTVESLNLSNAAAVALYELARTR